MIELPPRFILIVGSGSVAAANLPGLTHVISELGLPVVVLLTAEARRFVTDDALRHLGGARAIVDDATPSLSDEPNHILLSRRAAAVLVYPASAGFIGKMAHGLGLDVASTTLLCCHEHLVLVVPSTNEVMWRNPLVQGNLRILREVGMHVLATGSGTAPDVYRIRTEFAELLRSHSTPSLWRDFHAPEEIQIRQQEAAEPDEHRGRGSRARAGAGGGARAVRKRDD